MPEIIKIPFIGWRAGELYFPRMLSNSLRGLKEFFVVSARVLEAQESVERIRAEFGDSARQITAQMHISFSDFMKIRQGNFFFQDA